MERLVEYYSRPGDLVCDPCCGAGTALLAALRTGRRAVGGDAMREHAELAADRCGRRMIQRPLLLEAP
jgi:DNA modification methylase